MKKKFNDTGLCIPGRHYMVDTSDKIDRIFRLIEDGEYFCINRPRQFGKTTILSRLAHRLNSQDGYCALNISFEEIDTETFQHQDTFIAEFLLLLLKRFEWLHRPDMADIIKQHCDQISTIPALSRFITTLVQQMGAGHSLILLIDEVDQSSNNQLFLNFLGMLRNKYLQRHEEQEATFRSVILAGVHDVKTLKAKLRPDDVRKFNSPWNIAIDFTVDLSFSSPEIETMLHEYSRENGIQADIPAIADRLYYYTSGYPYLVSKLCKFIDEQIVSDRDDRNWSVHDVEAAFQLITKESYTTTLFDSLAKNLENNRELYDLVFDIIINGETVPFTVTNSVIHQASLYGIIAESDGMCAIHNRIYEQKIYAHIMSNVLLSRRTRFSHGYEYVTDDGGLDVPLILQKFQTFLKEHASKNDEKFLEREGRLLFLAFLRPILNGKGFEFKEPNVSDERRMDLVMTFQHHRYVIELKRWYGPKAHQKGLQQLCDYLDTYTLNEGYLLIYDFSKQKAYKQEEIHINGKRIFAIWV